jgi:hypothetical protein
MEEVNFRHARMHAIGMWTKEANRPDFRPPNFKPRRGQGKR